jgi:hypothetical protein
VPEIIYNNTVTTRNIIFSQTVHDGDFVYYQFWVTLLEVASIPYTTDEHNDIIRDALMNDIPWTDPLIYDPAHWIQASFIFDGTGALTFTPDPPFNPAIFGFKCQYGFVTSQMIYGYPTGTQETLVAFRRPFATAIQTRLTGTTPLFSCGVPPGYAISPVTSVSANTTIMPPTKAELLAAGGTLGQYGHTATLDCTR